MSGPLGESRGSIVNQPFVELLGRDLVGTASVSPGLTIRFLAARESSGTSETAALSPTTAAAAVTAAPSVLPGQEVAEASRRRRRRPVADACGPAPWYWRAGDSLDGRGGTGTRR
ncbi:MAG TPA: hypothetical protein VHU91_09970 [Mycobacteriales bacterium]|nr:hypothetical protein [Mycobacteriales bacterium]